MDEGVSSRRPASRTVEDDTGRPIRLADASLERDSREREALVEMYGDLDGTCRAMGIPPVRESELEIWLDTLATGLNVVAWWEDRVVGHAVLLPAGPEGYELAVFVHQDYQRASIGTELCRTVLDAAREESVSRVWLSVECRNGPAKRLFRSLGFTVVERSQRQLTMVRTLY